jgi:hypothetical protein
LRAALREWRSFNLRVLLRHVKWVRASIEQVTIDTLERQEADLVGCGILFNLWLANCCFASV